MIHEIRLNDDQMSVLLDVVKVDIEYRLNESFFKDAEEDVDLLKAIAKSFKDEKARTMLLAHIADYESKIAR